VELMLVLCELRDQPAVQAKLHVHLRPQGVAGGMQCEMDVSAAHAEVVRGGVAEGNRTGQADDGI
jgi:hypothetical protein